ncbi:hypothetical protein [Acerihabitans arboris]|uniref:Uncharacterized protein n=1 Tax=Acerihabitans arboris TaxID=2691583 RepID=A0A845SGF4_9GAMM|nr:hypothetical protein [Acerihabitans arboris]NDL63940.1 hypothetical protein [Acerihabitans arboris]
MLLSHHTFLGTLKPELLNALSGQYYLYRNLENLGSGSYWQDKLFNQDFKIFQASYNKALQAARFPTLLKIPKFGELHETFASASRSRSAASKKELMDPADQIMLRNIFGP